MQPRVQESHGALSCRGRNDRTGRERVDRKSSRQSSPLASSTGLFSPADVVFELFDGLLLVRDDCLDQVPDGNDADESSFIDNGQVANPLFSYGVHALRSDERRVGKVV